MRPARLASLLLILPALVFSAQAAPLRCDFRYAPPEWQASICLPDDPHKTLVDKSGQLLYDYHRGGREFGTRVWVEVADGTAWKHQQLFSPRVPIVQTTYEAAGLKIVQEAFAVTAPSQKSPGGARDDVLLVQVANTSTEPRPLKPRLVVDTVLPFQFSPGDHQALIGHHQSLRASLAMTGIAAGKETRRVIQLDTITVPPGKTSAFAVFYGGGQGDGSAPLGRALSARQAAVAYWQHAPLPWDRVQVPDPAIQALLDSSVRNIWQAREIKKHLPAFQVGPTCYRGLWVVDGAFLLEAAAMLGAGDQARGGVAYELTYQKPDGRIEVMKNYSKENGIVLWTCVRHAQLTQDKAWLESQWPKLERIAEYIQRLRQESLKDNTPLDDGLIPPGFIDGGLDGNGQPEYSNTHWNLVGLRAFIKAARWLGKTETADAWQREYDDFLAAFRKAEARDLRKDSHGNLYLPILMGDAGGKQLPQRAQWTFCHAVYPGQVFDQSDPMVAGNLAMLQATEREGMVYGTGWDPTGIWNYFASFYGHAWLWQGNGRKAAEVLYAFANHAAPVLDWREEQSLRGQPFRKVGDMPHNWASAEFIRLTVHLLALDRGDELHLLEGMPAEWLAAGMKTELRGVATPFGPLQLVVQVAADGKTATLRVASLGENCEAVVVHLPGGGRRRIPPRQGGTITFQVGRGR